MVELTLSEKSEIIYNVYNIKNKDGAIQINYSPKIKLHTNEICEILNNNDSYSQYINKEVLNLWKNYYIFFMRGLGAVSIRMKLIDILKAMYCIIFRKPNNQILINNLRCESHRWAILRALELKVQSK